MVLVDDVGTSSVTRAELLYGARLKPGAERLARLVAAFLATGRTVRWDEAATDLGLAGQRIGPFDTMIAAHALAFGATLVTNNTAHLLADLGPLDRELERVTARHR